MKDAHTVAQFTACKDDYTLRIIELTPAHRHALNAASAHRLALNAASAHRLALNAASAHLSSPSLLVLPFDLSSQFLPSVPVDRVVLHCH